MIEPGFFRAQPMQRDVHARTLRIRLRGNFRVLTP
jgi:hypothetical protein